ncbi:MAG TPA: SGNH/GDSL hydrolase family protein [Gaiellaceae bacterium]|nr:SGNH/GDSL hydrolase family protein [Gaiellaceae bacterium]
MTIRRWHKQVFGSTLVALAAVAVLLVTGAASQADPGHPYLALGDSVSFGYIADARYEYQNPNNFIGFPDYVGQDLGMTPTNASCPGETTAGFISATGADNGCRPYKSFFPLHTSYSGTQLDFATAFLNAHPNTKLITIDLGANDAFILQNHCSTQPNPAACIAAGLPGVLSSIGTNMDTIFRALQAAHFNGRLVVVNYYSLDYSDQTGTAGTIALNQAVTSHAAADGAIVADAFTAFKQAAASAGGHTCAAGLLNTTSGNQATCDVHPSQSGQQLLAQAVVDAVNGATGG